MPSSEYNNKMSPYCQHQEQRKSMVRFYPRVMIRETISVNQMTQDELEATWFQKRDFEKIRRRERKLHTLLPKATGDLKYLLKNNFGIEIQDLRHQKRTQTIRAYVLLVLSEQEMQWERHGNVDSCQEDQERLASFSERLTAKSSKAAQANAARIAAEIEVTGTIVGLDEQPSTRRIHGNHVKNNKMGAIGSCCSRRSSFGSEQSPTDVTMLFEDEDLAAAHQEEPAEEAHDVQHHDHRPAAPPRAGGTATKQDAKAASWTPGYHGKPRPPHLVVAITTMKSRPTVTTL